MAEVCVFCFPPGPGKHVVNPDALCAPHLKMSGIPQFQASHPLVDGGRPCNQTCGCKSFETVEQMVSALDAAVARREDADR